MEFFDLVILIFSFLSLFANRVSNIRQKIYYSTFFLTLATQLIFVGLKWQYYLIYILFVYKSTAMLFYSEPLPKYLKVLGTTLSISIVFVSSLLVYTFPVPSFNAQNEASYSVGYEEHLIVLDERVNPTAFIELSNLPENSKTSFIKPVLNLNVFLKVLKLPIELELSKNDFSEILSVRILILAPNALDPLTDVPIPLWTWRFSTDEEKSGKSTQKVPNDSASL